MDLREEAKSYLVAERYEVDDGAATGRLDGSRHALGGKERIFVWPADPSLPVFDRATRSLIRDMDAIDEANPGARKVLLAPSREGLPTDFIQRLKEFGVRLQTPIEFFDVNFAWDAGRGRRTAAAELADVGARVRSHLVAQPFEELSTGARGPNLLLHLTEALTKSAKGAEIIVITGPAGVGKSALFESLFAALYQDSQAKKRRRLDASRPIPLIPEYLDVASGSTVQSLLEGFLRTDFVRNVEPAVFDWMLLHGYATWMLDGLDEVIALDGGFLAKLEDLATHPDAVRGPRVVVCVRDSLLTTDEGLRELREYEDVVRVYRLERWERPSIEAFASLSLDAGARARAFVEKLDAHPDLRALAALPFYSGLLVDLERQGELRDEYSEENLVDHAVASMIQREFDKPQPPLVPQRVPEVAIREYAQVLAMEDFENDFAGIPVERAHEFAELLVPTDATEQEAERIATGLSQLPFFAEGSGAAVRFAQELIEQFFLGEELCRLASTDLEQFRRRIRAGLLDPHTLTVRMVVDFVRQRSLGQSITVQAQEAARGSNEFRNLFQIAVLDGAAAVALRNGSLSIEHSNLTRTLFSGCDLTGVSLRGSTLTDVSFENSVLAGARLEEAVLMNTSFNANTAASMQGAKVGNLQRFFSIATPEGTLSDPKRAIQWFDKVTGVRPAFVEPCPAAQQLRHLFGKYVRPDGSHRRDQHSESTLLRGARFANPKEALEEVVRAGYLKPAPPHARFARPDGPRYGEMVEYVRDLKVSPGLQAVLEELCSTSECPHVPSAPAS